MWYIVVFQPSNPSAETLIFSLKFDQFDPFSQMTQNVCYIKQKNSEILSKLRNSESAGGSASDSLYCMLSSGHNRRLGCFFVIDDWGYLEVRQTVFM